MNAETKWKIHIGKPVYGATANPPLVEIQNQDPLDPSCIAWSQPQYASLIVSAPDLLEACRFAFSIFNCDPHRGRGNGEDAALKRLELAIRKSSGEL